MSITSCRAITSAPTPVTATWPTLSITSEAGYCQAALAHMPHSAR